MPTSSGVLESYLNSDPEIANHSLFSILPKAYDLVLFNNRLQGGDFQSSLTYYLNRIQDASGAMIAYEHKLPYMSEANKSQLLWDLQITNLLLCAQELYDYRHQKTEDAEKYRALSERCAELVELLTTDYDKFFRDLVYLPSERLSGTALAFRKKKLQITYHTFLVQKKQQEATLCEQRLEEIKATEAKRRPRRIKAHSKSWHTKDVLEKLCAINDKRLYWVWGGGFVKLLLDQALAPNWFNYDASDTAHFPDPYTGCMSWSLYFLRLSINSGLFLKHLLNPSEDEKDMPWQERTNWRRRKYAILNDLLWGPANLACVLLNDLALGQGSYLSKVYVADVLTTILLVFDAAMALLEYQEEKKIHENEIRQFNLDIQRLEGLAKAATGTKKVFYTQRLQNTLKARDQCINSWHVQHVSLVINILYTLGLLTAFSLVALGSTCSAVVLVGTILCFAFTVLNNASKNGMDIYKTHLSLKDNKKLYNDKVSLFLPNNATGSALSEQEKKLLFLEIKELKAETDYQKAVIASQKMHCLRGFLLESLLIPAMIFLPIGLTVYPAIFALAGMTNAIINGYFKTEKMASTPFDEAEFDAFCRDPEAWLIKPPAISRSCFFAYKKTEETQIIPAPYVHVHSCHS